MKKVVRIILAILMVMCMALSITACKSECDKGNHTWDQGTVTKAATCSETGIRIYKCTECDHGEKSETIPKDSSKHTPISNDVAADCTHAGTTGATKCKDCGTTLTAGTTVAALNHDVKTWTVCQDNAAKHEGTCERTGCGTKVVEDHTPNAAGTQCTKCGAAIGTVEPPVHTHDYTGQPWKLDETAGKHYQECKDKSCGVRNEHDEDWGDFSVKTGENAHIRSCKEQGCTITDEHSVTWGAWTVSGSNHVHACSYDGCELSEQHEADFGAFITTDAANHYKQCADCDIKSEQGAHDHNTLAKIDSELHSVACSVCGKKFDNEQHDWVLDEDASTAATCSEEGADVYKCVCGAEKSETVQKIPHTPEFVTTETTHKTVCKVCQTTIIAEAAHETVWNNTDANEHYKWCKTCHYIDETTRAAHDYTDGFVCKVCERTPADVIVATYYKGEYNRFDTLVEAVASVTDNSEAVIYLGQDLEGAGIFIPENRNINFRLQGNTYTVISGAVGSKNYESQAFHIEKNSNITIQNGTITSRSGSGVKMLVQNYANLTLMNNVILDGTNLDPNGNNRVYTLSNNFGSTSIRNATIIAKPDTDEPDDANKKYEKHVAFDVWYGASAAYMDGVSVTLGENCTITGIIEYGSAVANTDWSKVSLVMLTNRNRSIEFSSTLTCDQANITFADGSKVLEHIKTGALQYSDEHHYYACDRCSAHVDEQACTKVSFGETKAATCTEAGSEAGLKCEVCGHVFADVKVIDALNHDWNDGEITTPATCESKGVKTFTCTREGCGATKTEEVAALDHDFAKTWTAVNAEQHAHKCSRCDAVDGASAHTYKANLCESCGREITLSEIIELMAALLENTEAEDYTALVSENSTFVLTGIYDGLGDFAENYKLIDSEGNLIIICYRLNVSDLDIGDEITVTGKIIKYRTTIEFAQGCTYELVKRGESEISVTLDNEQVEISAIPAKAERGTEVSFTVTAKDGFRVDSVTLNGQPITFADGKYTFTVTTENVIEIVSSKASGLPAHNDPAKGESGSGVIDVDSVGVTTINSYTASGTFTINGVTFNYAYLAKATSANGGVLQMRGNNSKGSTEFYNTTAFNGTITKVTVVYYSTTADGREMKIEVSSSDKFVSDQTQTKTITKNDLTISATFDLQDGKYIRFTPVSSASYITSITIEYSSETPCSNSQEPKHFDAVDATCTTDGNKEYWQCLDCNAYFIKNEAGSLVLVSQEDTIIKAAHEPVTDEWQHGTVGDKLSHWHACANCDEKLDLAECNTDTVVAGKTATCTEDGLTDGAKCDVCGQTTKAQETIGKLEHQYFYLPDETNKTHDVTCLRDGCDYSEDGVKCTAENDTLHKGVDTHWLQCVCGNHVDEAPHHYIDGECVCGAEEGATKAQIVWTVYTKSLGGEEWTNEDDVKSLINGLAATQFVGDTVTFTIDSNYRVVAVTNDDYDTLEEGIVLSANDNGEYSFTAASGNEIKIAVVRQYNVTLDTNSASGITVTVKTDNETLNLPAKVDDETQLTLVVDLGELSTTHTYEAVTYTIVGGNAVSILNADGTLGTIPVTGNVVLLITLKEKPAQQTWKKINNVNDITTDGEYILVYETGNVVAGEVSSTYMTSVSATINANEIATLPEKAVIIKIEGTTGNYKLNVYNQSGDSLGYYTTTAAKKMSLSSNGTSCEITFNNDNNVVIKFGSLGTLYYNASSPRFVNYTSSQTEIQLYKLS